MTLSERILSTLSESPLPVPTPDLCALCATGLSYARGRVLVELYKLERAGLVKRGPVRELVIDCAADRRKRSHERVCRVATWALS